jgi:hypothetical protein
MKDEDGYKKHEKQQDIEEDIFNLSKKLKLNSLRGGSLSDHKTVLELSNALKRWKIIGDEFKVADSSVPASSSQSGTAVSIEFNDIYRGNYHAISTPFIVQIKIGGTLTYEKSKALLDVSKLLLSKYSYETELGKSRVTTTDGTNWSLVMLTAPTNGKSYSTIYALK